MAREDVDGRVADLREDMLSAWDTFVVFDNKWNRLNDALNQKFEREGLDVLAKAKAKEVNVTLAGHMSGANWWRNRAQAAASLLSAELAYRQALER